MVQTQVTAQGWLGSTPEGRRPQIRGWRAGGSLAVASSTPATPLFSPAQIRELNHSWSPAGQAGLWVGFRPGQGFDLPSGSDLDLRPLCMRDMLRNATFLGFFENLGNHVFDASS